MGVKVKIPTLDFVGLNNLVKRHRITKMLRQEKWYCIPAGNALRGSDTKYFKRILGGHNISNYCRILKVLRQDCPRKRNGRKLDLSLIRKEDLFFCKVWFLRLIMLLEGSSSPTFWSILCQNNLLPVFLGLKQQVTSSCNSAFSDWLSCCCIWVM